MNDFCTRLAEAYAASDLPGQHRLVYGEGPQRHPQLMLIGEAPGAQEEQQGRPFVGQAGKNLNEFLRILSLQREQIYITNVVKLRPSRVSPKGTVSNRPPNRQELLFFRPWLLEEIGLVQPGLIVTLGNTALQTLQDTVIGSCHGTLRETTVHGQRYPLFPLYHPASVIYNRSLLDVYRQDLQSLKEILRNLQPGGTD